MIDWFGLAANALWIAGLALALGTISYASWQASLAHEKLGARLSAVGVQASLLIAAFLVCAGLFASSTGWIVRAIWALLGAMAVVQLGWLAWRRQPHSQ
jgi:hypothetical protein